MFTKTLKNITILAIIATSLLSVSFAKTAKEMSNLNTLGGDYAKVDLYIFSSLSCGYCARLHSDSFTNLKKDFVNENKIRIKFIDVIHPGASTALAHASLYTAGTPQDFFKIQGWIYNNQSQWVSGNDVDNLYSILASIPVSKADINKIAKSPEFKKMIDDNSALAQSLNIQGTPTLALVKKGETPTLENAQLIEGYVPYKELKSKINDYLKEVK